MTRASIWLAASVSLTVLCGANGILRGAEGATEPSLSGEGVEYGLAASYPEDTGLPEDPAVLFYEGLEEQDWDSKWQERSEAHRKYGEVETDPALVHTGRRSLRLDFFPEAGKNGAGWMNHWWDGSEVAYLRYYFRLSKGGDWSNQKTMQLHGHPRGDRYGRGAGARPTGYDSFSAGTGVVGQQGPPWTGVVLYSYWPYQKGGFGDSVGPNQGIWPEIHEEEWVCYEVMISLNDVGKANGEQRLWINGHLVIEQTHMEWRKADNMVINTIMQPTYTHSPPEPGHTRSLWIDSIVLAKRYIGPVVREKREPTTPPVKEAATREAAMPEAPGEPAGIAEQFPGDAGIEEHTDVLVFEDYEVSGLSDLEERGWAPRHGPGRWDNGTGQELGWKYYGLSSEPGVPLAGEQCLVKEMEKDAFGAIVTRELEPGEDEVYHRVYLKIPAKLPNGRTRLMGMIGANEGTPAWQPFGATTPPADGTNFYWLTLGLHNVDTERQNGRWLYLELMKANQFFAVSTAEVPTDRWFCLEVTSKLNAPGKKDGQLRLWIDGEEVFSHAQMRFRDVATLKTRLIFDQCFSDSRQFSGEGSIWVDNRVVARNYIGPMRGVAGSD